MTVRKLHVSTQPSEPSEFNYQRTRQGKLYGQESFDKFCPEGNKNKLLRCKKPVLHERARMTNSIAMNGQAGVCACWHCPRNGARLYRRPTAARAIESFRRLAK